MPNWKKVILSGSNAHVNNITASGHFSALDNSFTVNEHTSTELFVDGNIIATGNITGENYIVSSTIMHMTQSFSDGSTIFGDTLNDTHRFTGSLFITGITHDSTPVGDGVVVIDTANGRLYYTGSYGGAGGSTSTLQQVTDQGSSTTTAITASIISASGTITGNSIVGTLATAAQPNITSLGTLTALTVDQLNLNGNSISSTSDTDVFVTIGAAGWDFEANTGDKFIFNTSNQNNVDFQVSGENDTNLIYADASADKVGIGDATPTAKLDVAGNINTTSHITASGNISASGNILATGNISASGNVLATEVYVKEFIEFRNPSFGSTNFRLDYDGSGLSINQDGESGTNANFNDGSIKFTPPITASSHISASGNLFALVADNNNAAFKTVMYDTSTGKFFRTGSYGGGGGGGGTPAGVNKSIQFNNSGVFGGNDFFKYDSTFNSVSVSTSQAGAIGLASPNNGSSLFINTNRDLFLAERATPDTIFGVFDRLNRYLCLQPHTVNGSANTIASTHQPSARLHVLDKPQNPSGALIKSINQNSGGRFNLLLGTAMPINSTGTHRFISFHHTSGNDGGTALNGGIFFDPNNNIQGGLQGTTNPVVFQGVFIQSSDKKLKKHITFTKKGVDDIMSIKVKDFRWKEQLKDTPKNTGFIAQDLLETHPEMIRNIDGTLNVEYDKMIPLLVKAIQDQQHQIDDLKEQLKNKQL